VTRPVRLIPFLGGNPSRSLNFFGSVSSPYDVGAALFFSVAGFPFSPLFGAFLGPLPAPHGLAWFSGTRWTTLSSLPLPEIGSFKSRHPFDLRFSLAITPLLKDQDSGSFPPSSSPRTRFFEHPVLVPVMGKFPVKFLFGCPHSQPPVHESPFFPSLFPRFLLSLGAFLNRLLLFF